MKKSKQQLRDENERLSKRVKELAANLKTMCQATMSDEGKIANLKAERKILSKALDEERAEKAEAELKVLEQRKEIEGLEHALRDSRRATDKAIERKERADARNGHLKAQLKGRADTDAYDPPTLTVLERAEGEPEILRWFTFAHITDARARALSASFARLAFSVARTLDDGAERATTLRKLLEAKDAAVRARIAMTQDAADKSEGKSC